MSPSPITIGQLDEMLEAALAAALRLARSGDFPLLAHLRRAGGSEEFLSCPPEYLTVRGVALEIQAVAAILIADTCCLVDYDPAAVRDAVLDLGRRAEAITIVAETPLYIRALSQVYERQPGGGFGFRQRIDRSDAYPNEPIVGAGTVFHDEDAGRIAAATIRGTPPPTPS